MSRSPRKSWIRSALAAVVLIGCLLMVLIVFRQRLLPPTARWLDVGQPPGPAEFALVLPGGAETRPFVAAAMVRHGLVASVLVPGTVSSPLVDDGVLPSSQQINCRVLEARGVPAEQIIRLPVESSGTWYDALALRDFLEEHPQATVAVITNDFHTRRARWVFRQALPQRSDHLFFVSAPLDEFGAEDWWQYRDGLQTYLSEYCKFAVYLVLYGDACYYLVALAAVLLVAVAVTKRRGAGRGTRNAGRGSGEVVE